MIKKYLAVLCTAFVLLTGSPALASQCPQTFIKAMQQEGLTDAQIQNVCKRLADMAADQLPEITAEQIEKDIAGKMVAGWIFGKDEWRAIDILDSKYSGDKARIEINVDTIRNKSGTLRLRYKWTGSKWKLVKLFNVDFD